MDAPLRARLHPGRRGFSARLARRTRAWAERAFRLDAPTKEGGTLRAHLEAARRQGAQVPELEVGPPPAFLHFVLPAFQELCGRRPISNGVPLLLPPSEIKAWCELTGHRLSAVEMDLLTVLDTTWLRAMKLGEQTPI